MRTPSRRLLFPALTLGLALLFLEGAARLAIPWVARIVNVDLRPVSERYAAIGKGLGDIVRTQGKALVLLDEHLGWIYRPNHRGDRYSSNSLGARGRREYSAAPPPGVVRIAAFGDSFVHANEVSDREAWSAQLEAEDERVEVLNFGVGGFGTDQALMLFERKRGEIGARLVVLGFAEPNYARNLNRFRPFLAPGDLPLSKPRYEVDEGGELTLVPNPFPGIDAARRLLQEPEGVRAAGELDAFYDRMVWQNPLFDYSGLIRLAASVGAKTWRTRLASERLYDGDRMNARSEAYRVLVSLVRRMQAQVEIAGSEFLFVIFPGRDSDIWGGRRVYEPLLDALARTPVLDLAGPLRDDPLVTPATLRAQGRHYSALANRRVALAIREHLVGRGLLRDVE